MNIRIEGPRIQPGNPNAVECQVYVDGVYVYGASRGVDSSAGLGGYNLAEVQAAMNWCRKTCKSFVKGYEQAKNSQTPDG